MIKHSDLLKKGVVDAGLKRDNSPYLGFLDSIVSVVGHRIIKGAQATANNKQNKEKQMALFTRDEVLTQLQQGKSFYQAELSQINLQGANFSRSQSFPEAPLVGLFIQKD